MTSKEQLYYKKMEVSSFKLSIHTYFGESGTLGTRYEVTWFRPNGQDTYSITKEEYETLLEEMKKEE